MIFVDTNVFMYAVGGPHPLRQPSREFFAQSNANHTPLFTSAEVLQELVHAYIENRRLETLAAAFSLIEGASIEVWPLEEGDVRLAAQLAVLFPPLSSRDLCHLASCRRRGVTGIKTYDAAFGAVAENM